MHEIKRLRQQNAALLLTVQRLEKKLERFNARLVQKNPVDKNGSKSDKSPSLKL